MKQNEFNEIHVSNAKENFRFEYTPVQKTEYSEKDEFKFEGQNDFVPEKTNNDTLISDSSKKKNEEHGLTQSDLEQNVVQSASTSSSTSAVTSTTASAATSTVATAASVIAVASVSVVAGVSVIQNQNAKCSFNDLRIFTDRVEYALVLENAETENFVIEVNSNTYDNKKALVNGSNEGEFIGLNQGETYRIIVQEDIYGGKTLYDGEFTTSEVEKEPVYISEFTKIDINPVFDWENWTFSISLDFHDEDNIFTNFQLTIKDLTQEAMMSEEPVGSDGNIKFEYTYNLAKTTEIQTFELPMEDDETMYFISPEDELEFIVSAERLGVRENLQVVPRFSFDPEPIVVGFNGFYCSYEVSADDQLPVTLDIDGIEYFKDITLELESVARRNGSDDQIRISLPLEAVYGEQLIDVSDYISQFTYYRFKAYIKYSQYNLETNVWEENTFEDTSSSSISFVIDDAFYGFVSNYELSDDMLFKGTLSYRGDFGPLTLQFKDVNENSICYGDVFEVSLDAINEEEQEISISGAIDSVDEQLREVIYEDSFDVCILGGNDGVSTIWSSEYPIHFIEPAVQEFTFLGVEFDKTLYKETSDSVLERIFDFGVKYTDPNQEVDHFELRLIDLSQSSNEWTFENTFTVPADHETHPYSLEDLTDSQAGIEEEYRYELRWVDINGNKSDILDTQDFRFEVDSTTTPLVNGFNSDYSVDGDNYFYGTLDFNDDATPATLSLMFEDITSGSDIEGKTFAFDLDLIHGEQPFGLNGVNLGNYNIFDYLGTNKDTFKVSILNHDTNELTEITETTFDYVPDEQEDEIGFSSNFYLDEELNLVGTIVVQPDTGTFADKNIILVFVDQSDQSGQTKYEFPVDNAKFNQEDTYFFSDAYLDDLLGKDFDVGIQVDGITFWTYSEKHDGLFFRFSSDSQQTNYDTISGFRSANPIVINDLFEFTGAVMTSNEYGIVSDDQLYLAFTNVNDETEVYKASLSQDGFNEDQTFVLTGENLSLSHLVSVFFDVSIVDAEGKVYWEGESGSTMLFVTEETQEDEGTWNGFSLTDTRISNDCLEGTLDYEDTGSYFQNFRLVLYPQDQEVKDVVPEVEIDLQKTTDPQTINMYTNVPPVVTDAYGNSSFIIAIIADTPEGTKVEQWRSDTSIDFIVEGNSQPSEFASIGTNNHWIDDNNIWELELTYEDHQNIYQSLTVVIYNEDTGEEVYRFENVSLVTGRVEMSEDQAEELTNGTLYNVEFYVVTTNNPSGELLSDCSETGVAFLK